MKIFLTGSTGFIGSHLVKRLVENHDVLCLVPSSELGMRPIPENVKIEFSDLGHFDEVRKMVLDFKPDMIIHLGAATPVRYSFTFPKIYEKINKLGTKNLVDAALEIPNFKMFIFASSAETYGDQEISKPFPEDTKQNANSPYAKSKIEAEEVLKEAGLEKGFPHLIFRFTTTYGRDNETGYIIEYTITEMLKNKTIHVGTPDSVRDFMYIDDHVNSYLKGIEFEPETREEIKSEMEKDPNSFVFNIGPGRENKIIDVVNKLKEITGFRGKIEIGFPKNYPKRPTKKSYLVVDPSKANKVLGWKSKTTLDDGLKKAVEIWRDQF